jgi:hypothetical protein
LIRLHLEVEEVNMGRIQDLVSDGELVVAYALQNKITLPSESISTLLAARTNIAELENPGAGRDRFYAAMQRAVDVIQVSVSSIRTAELRKARLAPLVQDAQSLLNYAVANAIKVDEDIRNRLIALTDSVASGTPDLADEQSFYKAYETLTTATAPVTAETLIASRTILPEWGKLFSRAGFWSSFRDLTLGRFFDAILFLLVLILTCIALGYYSLGSTTLVRYDDLNEQWAKVHTQLGKDEDLVTLSEFALARVRNQIPESSQEAIDIASKEVVEAKRRVTEDNSKIMKIGDWGKLPDRLWKWSQVPCSSRLTAWTVCSGADRLSDTGDAPDLMTKLEATRNTVSRMNQIILPILLGWLGAHAFVLRQMTREIREHSFAKASFLHHLVRLSLGALAGFASTWLLTPELVMGVQLKNIPAWALAFVAGYGIELVFSFMDRIIAAFATKTS